jgi:hypothetical protein
VFRDETSAGGGGGWRPRTCRACKQPILKDHRATRIEFRTDPSGAEGLTGDYHVACSKPFASLARVVNMNPWAKY